MNPTLPSGVETNRRQMQQATTQWALEDKMTLLLAVGDHASYLLIQNEEGNAAEALRLAIDGIYVGIADLLAINKNT